jgi:hypothetical protein
MHFVTPRSCSEQTFLLRSFFSVVSVRLSKKLIPLSHHMVLTMNGGGFKTRARRSAETPKPLQEALPSSPKDAVPVKSVENQVDAPSETNPLPAKRSRLSRTKNAQTGKRSVLSTKDGIKLGTTTFHRSSRVS